MKLKAVIAAAALVVFAACSEPYRATNTSVVVVPDEIQTTFTARYPGATNIVWMNYDATVDPIIDWDLAGWVVMDASDYVVRFDLGGENYYAWYDSNGDWIGTAYAVSDYKSLPPAVNTLLNDKFPGYTISSVNREMKKGQMAYELQLKNGDSKIKMLVDDNGNIIKQKTIDK